MSKNKSIRKNGFFFHLRFHFPPRKLSLKINECAFQLNLNSMNFNVDCLFYSSPSLKTKERKEKGIFGVILPFDLFMVSTNVKILEIFTNMNRYNIQRNS